MPNRLLIAILAAGLGLAGPAAAKSEKAADKGGKPAAAKSGGAGTGSAGAGAATLGAAAGAALAVALLSDQDRHTIAGYFQQHPQPTQALPPGIARNVARGKPLPPGIARRGLPNDLTSQLSIPSGYRLESIGTDVVLVSIATGIIADVLKDALRG